MWQVLAVVGTWLLKNSVRTVLMGAGLSLVSYLGVLIVVRAAFNSQISNLNSISADLLNLMGIYGIDYVLSAFISVAVFLLNIQVGKLSLRKK